MMASLSKPFPLDGGRVGMGVKAVGADAAVAPSPRTTATPNPGPSPIKGEGGALADAVRDHYKPQGPADTVPTAPLTVAVALADKLDTLVGFFLIRETPTGSRDPFAIRRATLGLANVIERVGRPISLRSLLREAISQHIVQSVQSEERATDYQSISDLELHGVIAASSTWTDSDKPSGERLAAQGDEHFEWYVADESKAIIAFVQDRLKVLLRDQGQRHDLVDAVFALGDDDLVRIVRRVEALAAFLATDDGANLLAGYKRASNILRAEEKKGPLPTGMVQTGLPNQPEAETTLAFAAAAAGAAVDAALKAEDFAAAMSALARLRAPVDAFFEAVLVNSDVPAERENRLKLLGRVRDVMGRVADFGLISG